MTEVVCLSWMQWRVTLNLPELHSAGRLSGSFKNPGCTELDAYRLASYILEFQVLQQQELLLQQEEKKHWQHSGAAEERLRILEANLLVHAICLSIRQYGLIEDLKIQLHLRKQLKDLQESSRFHQEDFTIR